MKFEPLSATETTLDYFGKRGISWHGFCLIFYLCQSVRDDTGKETQEPFWYTVYLNQLISDSNKQDSLSVFALLDAAMVQKNEELPFISELILQTDNPKLYSNNFLLCAILLLNTVHNHCSISITKFIHTETQDGKTILDAFFARCMKFLQHYISKVDINKIKEMVLQQSLGRLCRITAVCIIP